MQGAPIGHRMALQDAPGVPWGQALAPLVEEHGVRRALGPGDGRPAVPEPVVAGLRAGSPSGTRRTLAPLPSTVSDPPVQVAVRRGRARSTRRPAARCRRGPRGRRRPGAPAPARPGPRAARRRPPGRAARSASAECGTRGSRAEPFGARSDRPESVATHAVPLQVAEERAERRGLARDRALARVAACRGTRGSGAASRDRAPSGSTQPPRSAHVDELAHVALVRLARVGARRREGGDVPVDVPGHPTQATGPPRRSTDSIGRSKSSTGSSKPLSSQVADRREPVAVDRVAELGGRQHRARAPRA